MESPVDPLPSAHEVAHPSLMCLTSPTDGERRPSVDLCSPLSPFEPDSHEVQKFRWIPIFQDFCDLDDDDRVSCIALSEHFYEWMPNSYVDGAALHDAMRHVLGRGGVAKDFRTPSTLGAAMVRYLYETLLVDENSEWWVIQYRAAEEKRRLLRNATPTEPEEPERCIEVPEELAAVALKCRTLGELMTAIQEGTPGSTGETTASNEDLIRNILTRAPERPCVGTVKDPKPRVLPPLCALVRVVDTDGHPYRPEMLYERSTVVRRAFVQYGKNAHDVVEGTPTWIEAVEHI